MTWRALRPIVEPLLRAIVGESVRLFLSPCCRTIWWQLRAIRLILRGRRARFAAWRYEVNRSRCADLHDEHCSAAEAADRVLAELIRTGDAALSELLDAAPHRRRGVERLLDPRAASALRGASR
jgi:hypothetical protein